ncbi:MAG: hypothetical protein Q8P82_01720 [bacterium]|nr:hypothetical protein [bacterium]
MAAESHQKKPGQHTPHPELARRRGSIFAGALGIFAEPSRMLHRSGKKHFERHYRPKYRHAKILFGIDLALVAVLLGLIGLAFWTFFLRTTLSDAVAVTTTIDQSELVSGSRVVFTVTYENKSRETLTDVSLKTNFPPYFEIIDSFPELNERTSTVFLDTLPPKSHGQMKISGIFWGDVGSISSLYYALAFRANEGKRPWVSFGRNDFLVTRSTLAVAIEAPDRIVNGQTIPLVVTYRNNSIRPIPVAGFHFDFPEAFRLISSDPKLTDNAWYGTDLAPNDEGRIALQGRVDTDDTSINFDVRTIIKIGLQPFFQGTTSIDRPLIPQPLALELSIERDDNLLLDREITAYISYENRGPVTLKNVSLGISSEGAFALKTPPAPVVIPEIAPGARGSVTVTIRIPATPAFTPGAPFTSSVSFRPFARYAIEDGVPIRAESQGIEQVVRVPTPLSISTYARYWTSQGDQIGRGSLPPVAGETTKYWIFWQIPSTFTELEKVTVTTTLPAGVEWTGKSSVTEGNALHWDAERRTVTWYIDRLDPTIGTGKTLLGSFEVGFTPSFDQVGTQPLLIRETFITAHDLFVDTDSSGSAPAINTSLPLDRRAAGRGTVQP